MIFIDFLFAFLIALVIAGLLSALFGGRGVRSAGAFPVFLFLFLLLLLMTWSGGIWITPFGPVLWGGYWLPFLVVGMIVALLLAAVAPPNRPPRSAKEAAVQAQEEEAASLVLGIFFWVTLIVLGLSIAIHYI